MIAVIDNSNTPQSLIRLIKYHQKKETQKTGELLINNTLFERGELHKDFMATATLKPKAKSRYKHISISFAPSDNPDNLLCKKIATEYLEQMNYFNCPYLLYRHSDTKQAHMHIVLARVNYNGELIKDSFERLRSRAVITTLEKKYSLQKTALRSNTKTITLNEINSKKYSLYKCLNRLQTHSETTLINEIKLAIKKTSLSTQKAIASKKPLSEQKLKTFFSDKHAFINLKNLVKESGLIKISKKEILINKVKTLKENCDNVNIFTDKMKKEGYYLRFLHGQKKIIIGGQDGVYLNEKQLPKSLQYKALQQTGKINIIQEKRWLTRIIRKSLHQANSFKILNTLLKKEGVLLHMRENKTGLYGINITNISHSGGNTYTISELGMNKEFSIDSIKKKFIKSQKLSL